MAEDPPIQQTEKKWGSAQDVLKILKEVNGRDINPKYLGKLVAQKRLRQEKFDDRTFRYWLPDAREIKIPQRQGAGNKTNHQRKKEQD